MNVLKTMDKYFIIIEQSLKSLQYSFISPQETDNRIFILFKYINYLKLQIYKSLTIFWFYLLNTIGWSLILKS